MSLRGRRVLVTGASGFIGSHLVQRIVRDGARVRAFVRYNGRGDQGYLGEVPEAERGEVDVYAGDLRDAEAVREAVKGQEVVLHLGALIAIPYSYVHPRSYVQTNVEGTLNVLLAAREQGVSRVVHTSSSEVFGSARTVPMDEAHPRQGQSPYSASKIGADMLAESFWRAFGVPVVTLRPFNTFGPRQTPRAIIPTIVLQALRGGDVRLGSLAPTRDFTYVDDTVDGFVRAAEAEGVVGEEMNLGCGKEISVGDLARRIFRILGKEPALVVDEGRLRPEASEVTRLLSDNRKARRLLGWEPRMPLDEGLARTIDWLREKGARFDPERYHR